MSKTEPMADRSAKRKASAMFDKTAQRQVESDRRVEEQKLADRHFSAKIERLRALRKERDAVLAREAAEAAALVVDKPPTTRKRKPVSA